ncbi:MAG: hypothetical protein JWM85_71 [Acidimicrobiaceae bacterium]|nr:hypothetical protein [Acidimicrobiaceae bacterium]
MSMLQFDPFRELDRFFGQGSATTGTRRSSMPMDAVRQGEAVEIYFDLPGVQADGIELTVEQNVLTVRAERHWTPDEGAQVLVSERPQGGFSRQVFLADNLDTERVNASYENGVLQVSIPVAEVAKARRIEVGSSKSEAIEVGGSSS